MSHIGGIRSLLTHSRPLSMFLTAGGSAWMGDRDKTIDQRILTESTFIIEFSHGLWTRN